MGSDTVEEVENADESMQAAAADSSLVLVEQSAPERKVSTEDPTAIIESLRARLLYERSSSKAIKQQAQQLARKVKELERGLQAEIEQRKRCEDVIQELVLKLEEAGVKLDSTPEESFEDPSSKKLKPKWISVSARQSSSDGSVEGDALNSNAGDQSPSGSPVSDTSLVPRRVGRSCRTLRRKEAWEMGIDDQVKGSWSKVGEDIVEISTLRDSEALGSESGWVSRAVEIFESKNEGSWSGDQEHDKTDQPLVHAEQNESSVDTETSINSVEDTLCEASNADHSDASGNGQGSVILNDEAKGEIVASESSSRGGEALKPSTSDASAQVSSMVSLPDPSDQQAEAEAKTVPQPDASSHTQAATAATDSVHDILRALRHAKQQLRSSAQAINNFGLSPGHRNSTIWQPSKTPGYSGLVVTRPLAQFVPAAGNDVFQIQNRSHLSYVDTTYFASPNRF